MIAFLADENFNNDILRGLRLRSASVNVVRVQDVGLMETPDPEILAWAADDGRVLLTHDVSTVTDHAYRRIELGLRMPGVFEVPSRAPVGAMIDEILILAECSLPDEWEGQVRYLPLR